VLLGFEADSVRVWAQFAWGPGQNAQPRVLRGVLSLFPGSDERRMANNANFAVRVHQLFMSVRARNDAERRGKFSAQPRDRKPRVCVCAVDKHLGEFASQDYVGHGRLDHFHYSQGLGCRCSLYPARPALIFQISSFELENLPLYT